MSGSANPIGVTTSPEGRQAAMRDLSGQTRHFPAMWWSPSDGQWFADVPGEGLMAYGAFGSREDSMPRDAQRLIPVGPLLELVAELATRQAECHRDGNDDAALAYSFAARNLAAHLPSLLGESPEPKAQEGDHG